MNKTIWMISFFAAGILCTSGYARSVPGYYTEDLAGAVTRNLVEDYGADGTDAQDDSAVFQRAIDELTKKKNGGTIVIPAGTYYLSKVALKSNVHLAFSKDAMVKPLPVGGFMITIGFNRDVVKNVSIRGIDGMVTFDVREIGPGKKVTPIDLQNVDNFLIENVRTLDDFTVHSSIRFNLASTKNGKFFPRNGAVIHADNTDAHVGYGTVQVGAGRHILFEKISGSGGVPLRLESGSISTAEIDGAIFDITGRDISGTNGNAVVMISPHAMENGRVDIDGVISHSCVHAVRVDIGDTKNGPAPGFFSSDSIVRNVSAFYGTTAQLKYGHFRWIPPELKPLIAKEKNPDGDSFWGPAAAAVKYTCGGTGPGTFKVTLENIEQTGFEYQPKKILTPADEFKRGR